MKTLVFLFIMNFPGAFAAPVGFCGSVDFRLASNVDLENLVYFRDLEKSGQSVKRSRCGLPGENLRLCSACNEDLPESSMQVLRPVVGSAEHLRWHERWHRARAIQEIPSASDYKKFQDRGLLPLDLSAEEFFKKYNLSIGGDWAGENFFYMHRLMIKMVQFELAMNGLPCVAPWEQLPSLHKSDSTAQKTYRDLQAILERYNRKEFLRSTTLNGFGRVLEASLHQQLHDFYRGPIVNGRACSPEGLAQGYCDDLLPHDTSPLNKYFWKIHGLVDQLLGRWLEANDYQEISTKCEGRSKCYEFKATWVGLYPRLASRAPN